MANRFGRRRIDGIFEYSDSLEESPEISQSRRERVSERGTRADRFHARRDDDVRPSRSARPRLAEDPSVRFDLKRSMFERRCRRELRGVVANAPPDLFYSVRSRHRRVPTLERNELVVRQLNSWARTRFHVLVTALV